MRREAAHRVTTLVVVLAMALAACSDATDEAAPDTTAATVAQAAPETTAPGATTAPDETPSDGEDGIEVLRLAGLSGNGYPTPFAYRRGPGWLLTGMMFDTLLWEDSTGEPIAWLAESWESSADGLEWRFTLRDATFHDGEPVTADDVVFTVDYVTNGPGADSAAFARGLRGVEGVVADGERDVVFTLSGPNPSFEEDVAMTMFVLPEHIWSGVDAPQDLRGPEATIGSGPYELTAADETTGSFQLTAFDGFHLGSPVVQSVEFVPVDDELIGLQTGTLVAAEIDQEQAVPAEQLATLEARFARLDGGGDWNRALHFNLAAGFPYDQPEFRRAVAHAVNRQDLVDRILFGRGVVASVGGLAPEHPDFADGLPDYGFDQAEAAVLLDGLGMVDADGDGNRDLPDGSPFAVELFSSSRFSVATAELIAENLLSVGLATSVTVEEDAVADERAIAGDYQMALIGYGGIMSDPGFLSERFSSEPDEDFSAAFGYANAALDEILAAQAVEVDRAARSELIDQAQRLIAEDLPILPLYVPNRTLFYDADTFDGWYYTPGCSPCRGSRNKHMYVTGG
jgi:peptide/nickel transport system substrate-binding protein